MSRRLVFGNGHLALLAPIGEINGRPIYPIRGAEGSEEDSDDGADDDGDDEDEGSEEDKDGDDEDDKPKQRKGSKRSDGTGSSTLQALRKQLRSANRALREIREEKRQAELADKSEVDRTKAEKEDVTTKLSEIQPKYEDALMQLEVIKVSSQLKLNWADIEDVLNDRKLREAIEIDDDGEITGVEEALKDLAKRKKHFLAKPEVDDDDESEEDKSRNNGKGKTGAKLNSGKNNDRKADRDRIMQKYGNVLGSMVDTGGN